MAYKVNLAEEKKLDKLQDIVTSLENLWMYDEAEELQEYLMNPRATASYIMKQFKDRFGDLLEKFSNEDNGTDIERDEEGNSWKRDIKWLEKIDEVENNYVGYKDVVKYEKCYLFYDNVLDRRMVRWDQRLWLSNIERDWWYNGQVSQSYIDKWTGVKEKLTWMPRTQDFTLNEFNNLINKHWIDMSREEVIEATRTKVTTRNWNIYATKVNNCPDLITIKAMIQDEMDVFEYSNEWEKMAFKDKIEAEKAEIKEMNYDLKKITDQENELKLLKLKAEREANELKKLATASAIF